MKDNLLLESVDQAIEELKLYRAAGGHTVVDVTSIGIRRVRNTSTHSFTHLYCSDPYTVVYLHLCTLYVTYTISD